MLWVMTIMEIVLKTINIITLPKLLLLMVWGTEDENNKNLFFFKPCHSFDVVVDNMKMMVIAIIDISFLAII